jgi:hypothetical protein
MSRRQKSFPNANPVGNLLLRRIQLLGSHELPTLVPAIAPAQQQVPVKLATPEVAELPVAGKKNPFEGVVDPVIWEMSIKNKEYYEDCALKDECRKPWFQYPRYSYQYSEFVFCTPDMMKELLAHNPDNRTLGEATVESYSRDNENNMWVQTHESLGINTLGDLFDGQHRAHMIIDSDKPWPLYITWNVPQAARFVVDSGKKRTTNEKLGLVLNSRMKRAASTVRSMMRGIHQTKMVYSDAEVATFAMKYEEVLEWVHEQLPGVRADVQAVVAKAYLRFGPQSIVKWCDRFRSIVWPSETDPARALHVFLSKHKGSKALVCYKKALSSIMAEIEHRPVEKLSQRRKDIFEWDEGWEVPKNLGAPEPASEVEDEDEEGDE